MANYYDVHVSYSAQKAALRHDLGEMLVEKGVLSAQSVTAVEAEAAAQAADTKVTEVAGALAAGVEPEPSSDPHFGRSTEDLRLALRI